MAEKKTKSKTKKKPKAKKKAPSKLNVPSPEELLEAGVHFGHIRRRWYPKMKPFIYTEKEGMHVFDLYKTHDRLEKAAKFLKSVASEGGKVLFVGTKRQAKEIVKREADRCGAFYITERWPGGLFTNFDSIRANIKKLQELEKDMKSGGYEHYTKKEQLMIDRKIKKLDRLFGGLRGMITLPDALVLVSAKGEETASSESKQKDIPVVAIADTNANPALVDYPIPGNDDSVSSIEVIIKTLADAVDAGSKAAEESKSKREDKKSK